MKKLLITIILLITTSHTAFAIDEHTRLLYNKCFNNNSIDACQEGRDKFCRVQSPYSDYNNCGIFELRLGILLYATDDYIGAHKRIKNAIFYKAKGAQKMMGTLCSKQSWVCNR